VERAAREVRILELAWREQGADGLWLRVKVSKGTYIRVLAEEIGRRLGCGAHLTALRRSAIGSIDIGQAITLDDLEAMALPQRRQTLMPVDFLTRGLPALEVAHSDRLLHGQPVSAEGRAGPGPVRLYDGSGRFLGLGEVGPDGQVAPKRLLAAREDAGGAQSESTP
jgi:tRNA pseudouridine55 synthase